MDNAKGDRQFGQVTNTRTHAHSHFIWKLHKSKLIPSPYDQQTKNIVVKAIFLVVLHRLINQKKETKEMTNWTINMQWAHNLWPLPRFWHYQLTENHQIKLCSRYNNEKTTFDTALSAAMHLNAYFSISNYDSFSIPIVSNWTYFCFIFRFFFVFFFFLGFAKFSCRF